MTIFYSKIQRSNPLNKVNKKWYVTLKRVKMVREKDVAKQIADETTLNPKEAEMALFLLKKILIRELMNGNSVQLGDWGSFYLTCKSDGKDTKEEVNAMSIQKINFRFIPGIELREALQKASFMDINSLTSEKEVLSIEQQKSDGKN